MSQYKSYQYQVIWSDIIRPIITFWNFSIEFEIYFYTYWLIDVTESFQALNVWCFAAVKPFKFDMWISNMVFSFVKILKKSRSTSNKFMEYQIKVYFG